MINKYNKGAFVRFQLCLGPFTMLLLEGPYKQDFLLISNHVFRIL